MSSAVPLLAIDKTRLVSRITIPSCGQTVIPSECPATMKNYHAVIRLQAALKVDLIFFLR